MRKILLALALMLFAGNAYTDSFDERLIKQLKVSEPNSLAYSASADSDCPVTEKDLIKMVEGVMVRSRVKPHDDYIGADIHLVVTVNCIPLKNNNPVYSIDVSAK